MIVISTNNGMKYLPKLLNSIDKFGSDGHKIIVVDTGSDDPEFIKYLKNLKVNLTRTPKKNYNIGTIKWTFENYKDDYYIFLHDSMEVIDKDWLKRFSNKMQEKRLVVAMATFPMVFNNNEYKEDEQIWLEKMLPFSIKSNPNGPMDASNYSAGFGIMGMIFYTSYEVLKEINDNNLFILPENRWQSEAMERGLGFIFEHLKIPMVPVHGTWAESAPLIQKNKFPGINKYLGSRL